ncbi:MAG: phosphohistidine phosphatase SixA [Nitrospiraceae bacterium]|nr:phosphohistidine phosphatase SixA [Nitrospiraceae bacterium]
MHLYLIQHGDAKSEQEDPTRPLSDKGRRDAEKVAGFLVANRGFGVENIFHSGKLRAQQTAEIFARHVPSAHGLAKADGLAPLDDPSEWAKKLGEAGADTMIVGHMPYLGKLAALLLCGKPYERIVEFRMGGIVCLKRDETGWAVAWAITPDILKS